MVGFCPALGATPRPRFEVGKRLIDFIRVIGRAAVNVKRDVCLEIPLRAQIFDKYSLA